MGVSTNGQICYGILLVDEIELPWDDVDNDIDKWWLYEVLNYKNPFEIFDQDGNWINGEKPPTTTVDEYYETQKEYRKLHGGLPITMINSCSEDYPQWIVAIGETAKKAFRGSPVIFEPSSLVNGFEKERANKILVKFCNDYDLQYETEPAWYLSSYWG